MVEGHRIDHTCKAGIARPPVLAVSLSVFQQSPREREEGLHSRVAPRPRQEGRMTASHMPAVQPSTRSRARASSGATCSIVAGHRTALAGHANTTAPAGSAAAAMVRGANGLGSAGAARARAPCSMARGGDDEERAGRCGWGTQRRKEMRRASVEPATGGSGEPGARSEWRGGGGEREGGNSPVTGRLLIHVRRVVGPGNEPDCAVRGPQGGVRAAASWKRTAEWRRAARRRARWPAR